MNLENDGSSGSAGSHFERLNFFNEVMTSSTVDFPIFSGFSAAILRDSGWYAVNETLVEKLVAGKNEGCEWIKGCKGRRSGGILTKLFWAFF